MSRFFAVLWYAFVGAFIFGLAGLLSGGIAASMFLSTAPPTDVTGAIWVAVGGFWGVVIGVFGGIVLALHQMKIGGD